MAPALRKRGVRANRLAIVPNAYAVTQAPLDRATARVELGLSESRFHIGWVGRISREKGLDVALAALAELRDLPVSMSVIGDGPERQLLAERAVELGVQQSVYWHGVRPDAARLFAAFDLFVLSSRAEGTPMVLFEAMDARTPIVATSVGGVPDVISEAEGILVAPDHPQALAHAIHSVYKDPQSARQRADAARKRLHMQFAIDAWVQQYADVYHSLRTTILSTI
jgi:glycosyltransferase involved in cell wall biosynthesis